MTYMNILIPDSWLRDYLKTDATPKQLKDCLSLCGPSIERINAVDGEIVYDIEVTTNRVDMMSVTGIAREASVILPQFDIPAAYIPLKTPKPPEGKKKLDIIIKNNPALCHRILAVKLSNIKLGPSPAWLQRRLTLVGQRPLNNAIDITNYVMWEVGHPVHAFDYDRLTEKKIIVREAKKGETFITLDGKKHTLNGGEIIFEDGTGTIIDLPGIMGTENTVVTDSTKNILLFIESSDPQKIRKASMGLSIRTQAAVLNEKAPDPELARTGILRALALYQDIASAHVDSELVDLYQKEDEPKPIILSKKKLSAYIGEELPEKRVLSILTNLGCTCSTNKKTNSYMVTPPTWRRNDMRIEEDCIEEVARIYGYHNMKTKLPDTEPPMVFENPMLGFENKIKQMLKGWGYTETMTYSMISEEQMDVCNLPKDKAFKITNPLSSEWIYMRPSLIPSMLTCVKENISRKSDLSLFELSMEYRFQKNDLPKESPMLAVVKTGNEFYTLKGIAEEVFSSCGIPFPKDEGVIPPWFDIDRSLSLGKFGTVGCIEDNLLQTCGLTKPVTVLLLDVELLLQSRKITGKYVPIPKYPPSFEDIALTLPEKTLVGPMIEDIRASHPLITNVTLLDRYKNIRTFHIIYQSVKKNLTAEDIKPIREKILSMLASKYQATLKTA